VVVVDVAGRIRRPGIVTLPLGSRVADALEAAGGVRSDVELSTLNLARVLVDGEQLLVGVEAATPPTTSATPPVAAPPPAGVPGALVDLNTATEADLDTLPGIGPVTAQAILDWRAEHGGFTSVDELLEVSGIGEVTLEELRPLVTV
jgi:competence protein ComEA